MDGLLLVAQEVLCWGGAPFDSCVIGVGLSAVAGGGRRAVDRPVCACAGGLLYVFMDFGAAKALDHVSHSSHSQAAQEEDCTGPRAARPRRRLGLGAALSGN